MDLKCLANIYPKEWVIISPLPKIFFSYLMIHQPN